MQLRNNFSSGPHGTLLSVANSGNGDDDAFNSFTRGSNATLQYAQADTFSRPTAEFVLDCATGATSQSSFVYWTAASVGTQNQIWLRFYCYFTTLPSNFYSPSLVRLMGATTTVNAAFITVNSSGDRSMAITDGNNVWDVRTTAPMVAGSWMRVEARLQFSATTGNGELRLYTGADADTETPTETITFSNQNLIRNDIDTAIFGYCLPDIGLPNMYWSGLEVNNTGWPGPLPFRQKASPGIQPNAIAVHNDVF